MSKTIQHVAESGELTAIAAASALGAIIDQSLAARDLATVALSGGRTPWHMLKALGERDCDWSRVHFFQADERIAPAGHADRNLVSLQAVLADWVGEPRPVVHPMPVNLGSPAEAAAAYSEAIGAIAGDARILDVVHLGLGSDGHTASLIPGDGVLEVADRDVAPAGPYQGRMRLSLTYPILRRARQRLWLVTGADKKMALSAMLAGDTGVPAGYFADLDNLVFADAAASMGA